MSNKTRPHADPLAEFLCFSVYSAGLAFNRLYRPLLDGMGLTYPQYLVMQLLWAEDSLSVTEVGEALGLESNTLTPLLKRLETSGLIERRRDTADERKVLIRLTARGRALQKKAESVIGCVYDAIDMPAEEIDGLSQKLARLRMRLMKAAEKNASAAK